MNTSFTKYQLEIEKWSSDSFVLDFIQTNMHKNISDLSLQLAKNKHPAREFIIAQIEGRQRTKYKLPTLAFQNSFVFPPKLNVEQSSSEATAKYKSEIFAGMSMLDLTGGMGVDVFYFSKVFREATCVDQNAALVELVQFNFNRLNVQNVAFYGKDSIDIVPQFIKEHKKFDLIYIDPARRDQSNKKLIHLSDCEPNVERILPQLWTLADQVMIKTSPMLDINLVCKALPNISEVHVVSVDNECKEVVYLLSKSCEGAINFFSVDLKNDHEIKKILFDEKLLSATSMNHSSPLKYLYEPSASLMKLGFWNAISKKFEIKPIAPNTHIFTSDVIKEDFSGRVFETIEVTKPTDRSLVGIQANVVTRNAGLEAKEICRKLKIKDGGDLYLLFFRDASGALLVIKAKRMVYFNSDCSRSGT